MLQAMNTGHDGSLTTVHANSPRDALSRLETMVLMAGIALPVRGHARADRSALDVIVHMARLSDGTRKVTRVTEVVGMEGDVVTMQDIFVFEQQGIDAGTAGWSGTSARPGSARSSPTGSSRAGMAPRAEVFEPGRRASVR